MIRENRLSSLIRTEVASLLTKKINDSRIGFITITYVKISKDKRDAWVYYSEFGTDEQKKETRKGLHSATKFIHGELSKIIRYMAVPKIHFRFDESVERGVDLVNKINNLD